MPTGQEAWHEEVDLSRIRGEVHSVQMSILSEHLLQLEEQGVQMLFRSTKKSGVQEDWQLLFSSFMRLEGAPRESNSAQESQEEELVQVWQGNTQFSQLLVVVFP